MANVGSSGASALEGLVAGFLTGRDVRRQGTQDREAATELQRRRAAEDQTQAFAVEDRGFAAVDRANAAEDRESANALRDFNFTQATGFARGEATDPRRVARLRGGAAEIIGQGAAPPPGYHRVGLGQAEQEKLDEHQFNTRAAAFLSANPAEQRRLAASPDMAAVIAELGLSDNLFDRGQGGGDSGGTYGVAADGSITLTGGTREEATSFAGSLPPSLGDQVSPEEDAIFDTLDLTPEMRAFVQSLDGEERQAFILDSQERPTATEQERRAASVLPRAEVGFAEMSRLVEEYGGAPGLSAMLGTGAGRFAQREQVQRFNAGARAVVTAILRVESGAAISAAETDDMIQVMVPQVGDKDATVELKWRILTAQMDAMRNAGSLVQGSVVDPGLLTPSYSPDNPFIPGR